MSGSDTERLGVLVHELRSPVAALVALSEALARRPPELAELTALSRLAVDACRSIERLLTDRSVASVRLDAVDVGSLVRSAVAAASLDGTTVLALVAPGLPALRGDPQRLRQALDNLVRNAIVHGGSRGDVLVRAALEGGDVVVSVADTGPGIPEADLGRIFEPGVSLAGGTARSGLGLAIARAIATAHGGALEVLSSPGEGSTFSLRLPVALDPGA